MRNKLTVLTIVLSMFVVFSCKDKQSSYKKINNTEKTNKKDVHKIVVNEFMNAGGYTYINVDEDGKEYWMAIPNTKVEKGATFYYEGGMVMKGFESKELKRTFDFITFAEGISKTAEEISTKKEMKNPHNNTEKPTKDVAVVKIQHPKGATTIGELYENPKIFKGKEVVVKGKVVKVNNGILDRNWIHIVDGTSFDNKSDLTVTSNEEINVGDIVTFKASVILDKDFGGGYMYPLLLENGEVVK